MASSSHREKLGAQRLVQEGSNADSTLGKAEGLEKEPLCHLEGRNLGPSSGCSAPKNSADQVDVHGQP